MEICQEKDISLTNVETYSELCQASKVEKAIFAKSLILNVSQGSFWIRFCNDSNDVMSQLFFFFFVIVTVKIVFRIFVIQKLFHKNI